MGKNRGTTNNTEYITSYGNAVDTDGHSIEFMETLDYHIDKWLEGAYINIIHNMSPDEINYIINHMQYSENEWDMIPTGHLTRIEQRHHTSNLKEGDIIKGSNLFRSFSRDPSSTDEILDVYNDWGSSIDEFVIYRTTGNTPFFDPTKFSNPYPYQTEVFVPMDTMRVSKIRTVTDEDELYFLTGMQTHIPDNKSVKVIDITPDENIKSVPVTLSSGETTIDYNRK